MKLNVKNSTVVGAAIFSTAGNSMTAHADVVTLSIGNNRNEHSFDEIARPSKKWCSTMAIIDRGLLKVLRQKNRGISDRPILHPFSIQ